MSASIRKRLSALEQRRGRFQHGLFIVLPSGETISPEQQADIDQAEKVGRPVLVISVKRPVMNMAGTTA